jgi:hypothetical protein
MHPILTRNFRGAVAVLLMLGAVFFVYYPLPTPEGNTLLGGDYIELHMLRIRYAQEALYGEHPHLPAWYSRQLMGTPFWSNIQSFPFIPTRLVLLLLDPARAYWVGVEMAACLAALFTYLFCRRLELARPGAAAAGFTFACSGYFASRIMAGHLPLLEAFPALPLLLWLVEVFAQTDPKERRRSYLILAVGLATALIFLAGHPQLPIYSLTVALLYTVYRMPGRRGLGVLGALAVGPACAAFALWPTLLLIGRSTRILPLDPPINDVALPYGRLAALLFPWRDGWGYGVNRGPRIKFTGYPHDAYFWDTFAYIGWLPWIAAVLLLVAALYRRRAPAPALFFATVGVLSLVLALPFFAQVTHALPGTFLRSPARQLYMTVFCLALAFGSVISWAFQQQRRPAAGWMMAGAMVLVAVEIGDLGWNDRPFVQMTHVEPFWSLPDAKLAREEFGDCRVAMDFYLHTALNGEFDDIGFFDSLMLAKPYAALLDVSGFPPGTNRQELIGSEFNSRALAFAGVKYLVKADDSGAHREEVVGAAQRATFFPSSCVSYPDTAVLHRNLRNPNFDLQRVLMVPQSQTGAGGRALSKQAVAGSALNPTKAGYARPSSDEILVTISTDHPGLLRVLESWDVGWHASVDGKPVPIVPGDDTFIALPLDAGSHAVRLIFSTPGAMEGVMISLAGVVALALLGFYARPLHQRST